MQSGFLDLLDMLDSSCKMLQDVPRCSGNCWMLLDAVGVEIQASAGRPEKVDVAVFVFLLQSPDPRQLTSLR